MARNDPQMNLRVPMELKEKVEKAAYENGRTITAEAIQRLEESFTTQYKESDLNMIAAGFCVGLYHRYNDQLENLNKELAGEKDEKRISLLKTEVHRMEILSKEMKSLANNMSLKGK